jgi:hypothetical protein
MHDPITLILLLTWLSLFKCIFAINQQYVWQDVLDDESLIIADYIGTMDAAPPRDPRSNKRGVEIEIDRVGWTAECPASPSGNNCSFILDNNVSTSWQGSGNQLPQNVTVHLPQPQLVSAIGILPDQVPRTFGNILAHEVYASLDEQAWSLVAYGTWSIDNLSTTLCLKGELVADGLLSQILRL